MALVVIVGGIDLSVGSMFALTDFCALFTLDVLGWPVPLVALATVVCGMLLGAVNGVLIGYLRLRAFITTLITLIIYRSAFDLLIQGYSNNIAAAFPDFPSWDFLGYGTVFGIPSVAILYGAVAIFGHIFMTRLRPGWHITAIGGSRRSAYNSGVSVQAHDRALLCRQRRPDGPRRALLRRAPRHGRRRHRRRSGSHRADGHRSRRHHARRRQGLGDEVAGRHADRAPHHQRPHDDECEGRRQPHGARRHPACRRDHRHPLAEEPLAHHQQGLCEPDLSRAARAAADRGRQPAARSSRTTSCAT